MFDSLSRYKVFLGHGFYGLNGSLVGRVRIKQLTINTMKMNTPISLKAFLNDFSDKEDENKYEWNDGLVEISESMNQEHTAIFILLMRIFAKTKAFAEGGGLTTETDMFTSETQLRRPDIAFFTGNQVEQMKKGENQIAPWVAEVISKTDNFNKADLKVDEYFKAGVEVVWQIVPSSKKIYVFSSPEEVQVCRGETICSAKPALEGLEIKAEELFK